MSLKTADFYGFPILPMFQGTLHLHLAAVYLIHIKYSFNKKFKEYCRACPAVPFVESCFYGGSGRKDIFIVPIQSFFLDAILH